MLNGLHRALSNTWRYVSRGQSSLRALIREKDSPAQGMVEFALVLPVLLLIIFGIIAFGHFFFNYSLVVAASREAARFGAAVGLTENSIPRYRDCDMIRQAAVQSGKLAGVDGTDATIQISYDQGPRLDGTTNVYTAVDPVTGASSPVGCPIGEVGPGFIELGDRIAVTVTVNYRPIVPLVISDSIPLTATTRRTIMLGMPVGEQPIAEASACVGTLTRIVPPNWNNGLMGSTSLVGQEVAFTYEVISDEPAIDAKGKLYFYVNDVMYATPVCDATAPIGTCKQTWLDITDLDADPVQPYVLRARYDPTGFTTTNPCFDPSKAEPLRHYILPAETSLTILSIDPSPSKAGEEVTVTVEVRPVAPAGGTPTGPVFVEEDSGVTCEIDLVAAEPGVGRGSCTLTLTEEGTTNIAATYDPGNPGENPNYNSSSAAAEHQVGSGTDPDPDPIGECPVFSTGLDVTSITNGMTVTVMNQNEFVTVPIQSITVNWKAADPELGVSDVSINDAVMWTAPAYPAPVQAPPVTAPVSYLLPGSPPGFPSTAKIGVGFTGPLPSGTYSITVNFGTPNPPITCSPITISAGKP